MAFSSSFKPLRHQNHLFSSTFCNKCPNFSHGFRAFSPRKHSKLPPFLHVEAHLETKAPSTEQQQNPSLLDEIESNVVSSFRSGDKRVVKESMGNDKRVVKIEDRVSRSILGFKQRRRNGSGYLFMSSKDENSVKSRSKGEVLDVKMDKATAKEDETEHLKMKNKGKRSKKSKLDSPVGVLTVGLDKCSKRGDVMGAIGIYDLAKREGINLEQYHYAVILYLCSSAATGVVEPAKSGSGSRSLSKVVSSNDNSGDGEGNTGRTKIHGGLEIGFQTLDDLIDLINGDADQGSASRNEIRVDEDVKECALKRGFEIYEEMVSDRVPMNEAILTSLARMAMSMGDGEMAFNMVKQMKDLGINPRLRSYGPALFVFCNTGNLEKAFEVEEHMLAHGVYPEEPELEALLKVSIETDRSDKVYYLLHKLRTSVRKVLPSTADWIETWFKSKAASRVGKRKWDENLIQKAVENGGGGWHGQGWLGKGKWTVSRSFVGKDGLCRCCGEKLVTIDLDPEETENFAESVASIARKREKNSSFERFQKWLNYNGPFEAVVDGANVGLFRQSGFSPTRVNVIANGVKQMLPSKKWPLIILHNRRVNGDNMREGVGRRLIEKWRKYNALYATPTGSNDDWYWLYAAIKFKCLLVTNDEMRDHLFQLLGNDFFPKWKERHQVRFSFSDSSPVYHMPPPCSVVIQESEKGHWHIPIVSEQDSEEERMWLCITRIHLSEARQKSINSGKETGLSADTGTEALLKDGHENYIQPRQEIYKKFRETLFSSLDVEKTTISTQIEAAEKLGGCVIDFQI